MDSRDEERASTQEQVRLGPGAEQVDLRVNSSGLSAPIARFFQKLDVGTNESLASDKLPEDESDDPLLDIDQAADELIGMLNESRRDLADMLVGYAAKSNRKYRRTMRGFHKRLEIKWGRGLDLLDLFLELSLGYGAEINSQCRQSAFDADDILFDVIMQQHSKACRIVGEMACLLRSGFADGAHARWRSLHETAVISRFIVDRGERAARLFRVHEKIHVHKGMGDYQRYHERLGYDPLPDEVLFRAKHDYDELIERYGKEFAFPYGWAARVLGITRCGIERLEEEVGLSHMRPFYRMASENVHPYSRSSGHELGLSVHSMPVLLSGPSDAGLADPGHQAALSMNVINGTINTMVSTIQGVIMLNVLVEVADRIGDELIKSHWNVESLTEANIDRQSRNFKTKVVVVDEVAE